MKKVLITGASGFLGSHIVEELLNCNYDVYCLKRTTTDIGKVDFFQDKVTWINIDEHGWKQHIIDSAPAIFIHSGWHGVGVSDRMEWDTQFSNLNFLMDLLDIAATIKSSKFISFGSQAEYGVFAGSITEEFPVKPTTAYGAAKLASSVLVKRQCTANNISWYWLRLFSVFGERESGSWFIPTVINSLLHQKELQLTGCEQVYAYMYVKDLASLVRKIVELDIPSDIYNVSSKEAHALKTVVEKITDIIQPEFSNIQFGAIPYRENQPMHMQGDINKLLSKMDGWKESNFEQALQTTVEYFKQLKDKESNG